MSALVFEGFLSTGEMLGVFDPMAFVQAMLDVESALAQAQADEAVIPIEAARVIRDTCQADELDVAGIVSASGRAGSLAIPLVKQLTQAVARRDEHAARYVHWGSTSQDIIDTAMVLCERRALALIDRDAGVLIDALIALAHRHGDAPVLARTLMQPAQVVSLGFKLVSWIAPLVRGRARLRDAGRDALQIQLGGAVGTLAVMGDAGEPVARRVADALALRLPPGAWHTQRDDNAVLACALGVLAGSLGKIARDLSLMSQAEVGEMAEPSGAGRGGSSAMPHKRNPVAAMVALAGALRTPQRVAALLAAMPQEHERGLGNWQAELAERSGLYLGVHGALKALADAAGGLQVDRSRMLRNIDALHGLVFAEAVSMAFAEVVGREAAHALVERLSQDSVASGRDLCAVALEARAADAALRDGLDEARLKALFDPAQAAQRAVSVARPQLQALGAEAASMAGSAPWARWLPT